jgi:hypothetical protein
MTSGAEGSGDDGYGDADADTDIDGVAADGPEEAGPSLSRRTLLKSVGALSTVSLLASDRTTGATGDPWTVVALPDTQFYAERSDWISFARDQTEWIRDNVSAENIAFVTHEGDVVENGDVEVEWQRMDSVMSELDGVVPYSVVTGNHDYADLWDRSSGLDFYKQYFGPSRFSGYDWFGGSGSGSDGVSTYQLFSAGGYDFLHLALEWEPRDATLDWAQTILDQYPDRPTIVTTHSYLRDEPSGRVPEDFVQEGDGDPDTPGDGNAGETVWQALVKGNPQVFMVLNGHWHNRPGDDEGEFHQVSTNDAGRAVYEMLANYQYYGSGGDGWMRLLRFEPGGGSGSLDRIQVETYSPSLDQFATDNSSQFGFDLDFDARFAPADSIETARFQQGSNGYTGTVDTYIQEAEPDVSNGSADTLNVDTSDPQGSGQDVHALVRFDGIIGTADGQVPPTADLVSATLTLETVDEGDAVSVHRMYRSWNEGDDWNDFGDGVQADDTQARSTPVATPGPFSVGPTTVDVTASVAEWLGDATNHGWVFLPTGGNGWDFSSSEGSEPPTLTVRYTLPETVEGDADGDGDVDGDDVEAVQRYVAGYDEQIDEEAADVDDDGDVDIVDAAAIDDMRGD